MHYTQAGKYHKYLKNNEYSVEEYGFVWKVTPPFHGGNRGSNPLGDAKYQSRLITDQAGFFISIVLRVWFGRWPTDAVILQTKSCDEPGVEKVPAIEDDFCVQ